MLGSEGSGRGGGGGGDGGGEAGRGGGEASGGDLDGNSEEPDATAVAEDFKHDFFGKVDAFHWAPKGGDLGCSSISEFSTDLYDEVEMSLHWFKGNASKSDFFVSVADAVLPTKLMRFVFDPCRMLFESG